MISPSQANAYSNSAALHPPFDGTDITALSTVALIAYLQEMRVLAAAIGDRYIRQAYELRAAEVERELALHNGRAQRRADAATSALSETERCHLLSIKNQLSYAANLWRDEIATLDRLLAIHGAKP